jgi:hypothetical protein
MLISLNEQITMYYYCVNHNSLRIPRWRTSPRGVSAGPFVPRNGLGLSLFFEPIEGSGHQDRDRVSLERQPYTGPEPHLGNSSAIGLLQRTRQTDHEALNGNFGRQDCRVRYRVAASTAAAKRANVDRSSILSQAASVIG